MYAIPKRPAKSTDNIELLRDANDNAGTIDLIASAVRHHVSQYHQRRDEPSPISDGAANEAVDDAAFATRASRFVLADEGVIFEVAMAAIGYRLVAGDMHDAEAVVQKL